MIYQNYLWINKITSNNYKIYRKEWFIFVLSKVRSSNWEGIEKIPAEKINWLLQLNYRGNAATTKQFVSEAQPQPQPRPVNLEN